MIARADVPRTVPIEIDGVVRDLPVREVKPGVHLGILLLAGDPELTEAAGRSIARRMPLGAGVLVMPDGKAQALLHVVQRETGLRAVLVRKQRKPYLVEPVIEVTARSVTSDHHQPFYLGADDRALLDGRDAVILDDVVSTGETIRAIGSMLQDCGVRQTWVVAVGTEGDSRPDVISLVHLPVYLTEPAP